MSVPRGVCAVIVSMTISGFWSFWGAIECFHEGWYYHRLADNLELAFVQYWGFPIAFSMLAAIAIWKPRIGGVLFAFAGILVNALLFHFQNWAGVVLILAPCLLLAGLFGFGSFPKPILSSIAVVGFPALIIVVITVPLAIRVAGRDTNISDRPLVWTTASETLVWAPPGPGWPKSGVTFEKAQWICQHLTSDGKGTTSTVQNLWRLPAVQEAERALNQHRKPAGCDYSGKPGWQPCRVEPDKEAPLWDPFSQVIYWWTATDNEKGENLRVAYNGYVLPVRKTPTGYTGFRAVRALMPDPHR